MLSCILEFQDLLGDITVGRLRRQNAHQAIGALDLLLPDREYLRRSTGGNSPGGFPGLFGKLQFLSPSGRVLMLIELTVPDFVRVLNPNAALRVEFVID